MQPSNAEDLRQQNNLKIAQAQHVLRELLEKALAAGDIHKITIEIPINRRQIGPIRRSLQLADS